MPKSHIPKPNPPTLNAFESSSDESGGEEDWNHREDFESGPDPFAHPSSHVTQREALLFPELLNSYFPSQSEMQDPRAFDYLIHLMGVWDSYGIKLSPEQVHSIRTSCQASNKVLVTHHGNTNGQSSVPVTGLGPVGQMHMPLHNGTGQSSVPVAGPGPVGQMQMPLHDGTGTTSAAAPPIVQPSLAPGINLVFKYNIRQQAPVSLAYSKPFEVYRGRGARNGLATIAESDEFEAGAFENGQFENGACDYNDQYGNGASGDSQFENGEYENGEYGGGESGDGHFENGAYENGEYGGGESGDGQFENGADENGEVENGPCENGEYEDGAYGDVQFENGAVENGEYENGLDF